MILNQTRVLLKNRVIWQNVIRTQINAATKVNQEIPLPFDKIPGPTRTEFLFGTLNGEYKNLDTPQLGKKLREKYGNLVKLNGMFGGRTLILSFDPNDFETFYRKDGPWPVRYIMDTFVHHRKVENNGEYENCGLIAEFVIFICIIIIFIIFN